MTRNKSVKDQLAGKAKRLAGETLGDQKLDDEGKAQEQSAAGDADKQDKIKSLGNLDQLT
jgi:uncharacterized protein YjbJ (UPF0337 family)